MKGLVVIFGSIVTPEIFDGTFKLSGYVFMQVKKNKEDF